QCLVRWARERPDQVWLAVRDGADWRRLTYAAALDRVRALAQAILDLGLSAERPVAILSENSIEHALVAAAAQFVGVPSAAISTAYALLSSDHARLKLALDQVTPGLVFVQDAAAYGPAIAATLG